MIPTTRSSTGVVTAILVSVFILASVPGAGAVSSAAAVPVDDISATSFSYSYHKMTYAEMSALRGQFGTKDLVTDYNVLVEGHGTGLSPPSAESWSSMVGTVNVLDSVESDLSSVPASLDLSTSPSFPIVGNQAAQPSCAAWAATYYAYGFAEAKDLGWTEAKSGSPDQLMSPGWTYNRVNGGRDSGSMMDENMFVIRDWGVATLATMPYDDSEYLDWGSPSAFREAPEHRAMEVFYIPFSGATTIDEIKAIVSEGTLVTFGIDANQYLPGFADNNYIISSVEYSSSSLNHAQTIVGFDDSVADDGDEGAFRVVNSWGAGWGDEGFYWMTYDTILELGAMNALYLNYISDIPDYSPELVAAWHFNSAPSRSADLEVGIGPTMAKSPFFVEDRSASHTYPTYMCLDITEFSEEYASSDEPFYLDIGSSSSKGTISSFKVEEHAPPFLPGKAARTSAQSEYVPRATPGMVTVNLPRYDPITYEDALEATSLVMMSMSEVEWVGVADASATDGDSLQSGDVGDGEATSFALTVTGPATLSFKWKISSESGNDVLSFEVLETGAGDAISGEHDWSEQEYDVGEGAHTLVWSYSKDSATSELDDTAWLDSLLLSAPIIDFSLDPSYEAVTGQSLTVSPREVFNPSSSELWFWFDWGDDSSVDPGDPEDGYSASHTYASPGTFDLSVTMEDDSENSVTRHAQVTVDDANQRPSIVSVTLSPSADYYEPYSSVRVDVSVSDAEGDSVTVSISVPSEGATMEETMSLDPLTPTLFSFDYECPSGSETPYDVVATASDDAEHLVSGAWDSETIALLVNSPPTSVITVDFSMAVTGQVMTFDASGSSDEETISGELEFRWDWESDGEWDTDWSTDANAAHCYQAPGDYDVTVEVKDGNDLSSTSSLGVTVTGEPIPEFSAVLIPVVAVLLMFVMFAAARRSRR